MKDVFERLTSRMDKAKERISEFEEMSIGTSKAKKQREKKNNLKWKQNIQKLWNIPNKNIKRIRKT